MESSEKAISSIQAWQDWYKNNRLVASLDQPLITKDSREKMHETSNARLTLEPEAKPTSAEWAAKMATNDFADVIASYGSELSATELYKCLVEAANENFTHAEKEYNKAKRFLDHITNRI